MKHYIDRKTMIYLDNNSTTPLDPEVSKTITDCFNDYFANPASVNHYVGIKANEYLEKCRAQVALMLEAEPNSIIFNSGASEANNTVIRAVIDYYINHGKIHIITSSIEHKCLINVCNHLSKNNNNIEITYLPVNSDGKICLMSLEKSIKYNTKLISIMAANNETGVLQPLKEISEICQKNKILFHTDAAQWIGKLPFSVREIKPNFVSMSAHKFYGPKGIGALYCSNPEILLNSPLIHGGGQEFGLRSGTVNLPGIAGMAKASEIFMINHKNRIAKQEELKKYFIKELLECLPQALINGSSDSLPNTVNFSLLGVKASTLLKKLKMKIALGTASACNSHEHKPSHVLNAMGLEDEIIESAIRLSFNHDTDKNMIDSTLNLIEFTFKKLRNIS